MVVVGFMDVRFVRPHSGLMDPMFVHLAEHRLQAAETDKRMDEDLGIPEDSDIMLRHREEIAARRAVLRDRRLDARQGGG